MGGKLMSAWLNPPNPLFKGGMNSFAVRGGMMTNALIL